MSRRISRRTRRRRRRKSDLDIELADGAGDVEYLDALERGIRHALSAAQPDLVIYLDGADPHRDDHLSRLGLSKEGLWARDRMVFELCGAASVPPAVTMAGGYAGNIGDSVDIHFATVATAAHCFRAG